MDLDDALTIWFVICMIAVICSGCRTNECREIPEYGPDGEPTGKMWFYCGGEAKEKL